MVTWVPERLIGPTLSPSILPKGIEHRHDPDGRDGDRRPDRDDPAQHAHARGMPARLLMSPQAGPA
jgi:hypothetical protein